MVTENLKKVEERVCAACERAGRDRSEVTLIAVSKTKPVSMIEELYEIGVRDFGENKVQELTEKYEELPKDICWHLIGHLQRNKVKYVADKACLIHSVDSLRLAQTISEEAQKPSGDRRTGAKYRGSSRYSGKGTDDDSALCGRCGGKQGSFCRFKEIMC